MVPASQDDHRSIQSTVEDIEGGITEPLLAPYRDDPDADPEQADTPPVSAPSPDKLKERLRRIFFTKRLLYACIFALVILAHLPGIYHGIRRSRLRYGIQDWMEEHWSNKGHPQQGNPAFGSVRSCVRSATWRFDDYDTLENVLHTSFNLPVSSGSLLFTSIDSPGAHGSIDIAMSDDLEAETVAVNMSAYYQRLDDFELINVCLLGADDEKSGVGIFAPEEWSAFDDRGHVRYEIAVRLPTSYDGSLSMKTFQSSLPFFRHEIGDIADRVTFDSISLSSQNMPIIAQSLVGRSVMLSTSNAYIEGSINSTSVLNLQTWNAPILANISLFSDVGRSMTQASLRTTNGHIHSDISLYGSDGPFIADFISENAPLDITVLDAPNDVTLYLTAYTSNSPVNVSLYPTYEGGFNLRSSPLFRPTLHIDPDVEDPTGQGRQRSVLYEASGVDKFALRGTVQWASSTDAQAMPDAKLIEDDRRPGHIVIVTSNSGVNLSL